MVHLMISAICLCFCSLHVWAHATLQLGKKPNILMIVTDQERYPPAYESSTLSDYRARYFTGRNKLLEHGLTFHRHYISSAACVPSRTCLYTGQHVDLTGSSQTDGLAKPLNGAGPTPLDSVSWLPPKWVPTLGHYLQTGGYDTTYLGKWHLSQVDLPVSPDHLLVADSRPLDSAHDWTVTGVRNRTLQTRYRQANVLSPYGFDGWMGPEPHGTGVQNSGIWRDTDFTDDAVAWLQSRDGNSTDDRPFFLSVNLVNPHDICLIGLWNGFGFAYDSTMHPVPDVSDCPSRFEELRNKPKAQQQYRDAINGAYLHHTPDSPYMTMHLFCMPA
jgi:arylsulfatase A-like enzyme